MVQSREEKMILEFLKLIGSVFHSKQTALQHGKYSKQEFIL